jgi:hypothetical protein
MFPYRFYTTSYPTACEWVSSNLSYTDSYVSLVGLSDPRSFLDGSVLFPRILLAAAAPLPPTPLPLPPRKGIMWQIKQKGAVDWGGGVWWGWGKGIIQLSAVADAVSLMLCGQHIWNRLPGQRHGILIKINVLYKNMEC